MIYCFFIMFLALSCFQHVLSLDQHVSMLVYMSICLSYMLYALCHVFPCLFFFLFCVDVWIYMLKCLISCLWLCLTQIYMFLCSYAYVYAFTCLYAWICVLPCFYAFIHMLRCTFTCLHAYFHAYMCRSVCLHAQIDVLYMLYAIIYVLVCFTLCLCAQALTLFVMPRAIVASPIWLCTLLNPFLPPSFFSQMGCIMYIMSCTIHPHLQSMATLVYFSAPIFWALLQGCRHLLSCSVCLHASRHAYALRPRSCLSCHVLLQPFCSFYRIFLCFSHLVGFRS